MKNLQTSYTPRSKNQHYSTQRPQKGQQRQHCGSGRKQRTTQGHHQSRSRVDPDDIRRGQRIGQHTLDYRTRHSQSTAGQNTSKCSWDTGMAQNGIGRSGIDLSCKDRPHLCKRKSDRSHAQANRHTQQRKHPQQEQYTVLTARGIRCLQVFHRPPPIGHWVSGYTSGAPAHGTAPPSPPSDSARRGWTGE